MAQNERRQVFRGNHVRVDFVMNRSRTGIAGVALSSDVRDACIKLAETEALPYAVSISPRSGRHHRHYQDSFYVEPVVIHGFPRDWPMSRVAARLVNNSDHAIIVEVGDGKRPGHRVLRRTIDHLNGLNHPRN